MQRDAAMAAELRRLRTALDATNRALRAMRATENQLHQLVFEAMTFLTNMKKLHCVWFPVPNGVNLPLKVAQILKGTGKMKAGVSDFVFVGNGGGLMCELKTTTGRQSEDQEDFERECKRVDVKYVLCRSLDDVLRELVDADFLDAADAAMFAKH